MDAPGNDGNASMPEQVKRPNPWRKMMMMVMINMNKNFIDASNTSPYTLGTVILEAD